MTSLAYISIIVTAAALFGWLSVRVFRLPITIGTMLLTVILVRDDDLVQPYFSGTTSVGGRLGRSCSV